MSVRHTEALKDAIQTIQGSSLARYVDKLYLYGSCARGTFRFDSDVDLFLVLKKEAESDPDVHDQIIFLKGNIGGDDIFDVEIDLKVVIGDGWESCPQTYYEKIRKEGIRL